jgi:hypothetical protein
MIAVVIPSIIGGKAEEPEGYIMDGDPQGFRQAKRPACGQEGLIKASFGSGMGKGCLSRGSGLGV